MTEKTSPKKTNKFPFLTVILAVVALGVIFTAGGFAFAATQEQHDSFCTSCHSQPESTFYQRSIDTQPTDLASFHTAQKTNCIDCHSGVGVGGRVAAEVMGARNALLWYSGKAKQPAPMTVPISDLNCLKCHQNVVQRGFAPKEQITIPGGRGGREGGGRNNHWHEQLAKWQAASATAGTCTSCHNGHITGGTSQSGFLIPQTIQTQCNACHSVLRREGGDD